MKDEHKSQLLNISITNKEDLAAVI